MDLLHRDAIHHGLHFSSDDIYRRGWQARIHELHFQALTLVILGAPWNDVDATRNGACI